MVQTYIFPSFLLKKADDFIRILLLNCLINSGNLPNDWVTANVVSVHKKRLPTDYRPISPTSVVVKVMVITKSLNPCFCTNDIQNFSLVFVPMIGHYV